MKIWADSGDLGPPCRVVRDHPAENSGQLDSFPRGKRADMSQHVCKKVSAFDIELENQIWNRARLTRECSPDGHVAPGSVEQRHTHRSDRSRYLPQQPRPVPPRRGKRADMCRADGGAIVKV